VKERVKERVQERKKTVRIKIRIYNDEGGGVMRCSEVCLMDYKAKDVN